MVDSEQAHLFETAPDIVSADVAGALGGIGIMGEKEMLEAQQPHITATRIVDGLGFGEGPISFEARRDAVGPERLAAAEAIILSDEILVPISKDSDGNVIEDDGCGDGREVGAVLDGHEEVDKPSLNRAKVFGGGATMGTAARIANQGLTEPSLYDAFSQTMDVLDDKLIGYGAHTDDHAHGENCGCGAIDKAPVILANAVKYREQIEATISALGLSTDGIDAVFSNFAAAAAAVDAQSYSGKLVSDTVKTHDKVTKVLSEGHAEMSIVLNTQPGMTVNQEAVRAATDGEAQAFATDVWRLQEIAERMYPEDQQAQQKALQGELIYTLATAATLTAGDLPVYVVKAA